MPISLCMIVKDEAEWIGKCLAAAKGLADQMVVVDTGSSDNTVEIAKGLGAEVYFFEWNDDTSAARNEGLKHATGDWVLVLDADETISSSDFGRIKKLAADAEYDGYALVQRNYTNDTYREDFIWATDDSYGESKEFTGWVPRLIVRLFRNKPGIRFEGIAHELVELSIEKSGGKYAVTDIPIHHFKGKKLAEYLKVKPEHYRRIGEKKLAAEPNNPRAWHEMGTVEREAGNFAKAKEYFEKALELNPQMVEAYQSLGVCCSSLGDVDGAIAAFRKAIGLNPTYPTPYFSLGVAYAKKRMLNEARDAIESGLKLQPNNFNAITNLGAIYEQGSHPEIAVKILQKVVEADKGNARAYYNLAVALEKLGLTDKAEEAYAKAAQLGYKKK